MYELAIMLPGALGNYNRRHTPLPRGLEWGKPRGYQIVPTDELCEWLTSFTRSHATIELLHRNSSVWEPHREVIGVSFGFREASDALLFKLTWL